MSEITVDWSRFEAQFALRVGSSVRLAEEILKEQMRGILRNVIAVTPPGHAGAPAGGRAATAAGKARVASDISKLYGAPSAAFDAIHAKNPADARAFWAVKRTRPDAAADIVREHTGTWYGPLDGGALHKQRFKRGRVSGRKGRPILYISDPAKLRAYTREQQAKVHFLAGGWRDIAAKLGIELASAIAKHNSPSSAIIQATMERVLIRATNQVSYASDNDLNRRIQFAIDAQAGAMQRQWQHFLDHQFRNVA